MAVQYENSEKDCEENSVHVNIPQSEVKQGTKWFHTCSLQYLFLISMLVLAVLVSFITLIVFLTRYHPVTVSATNLAAEAFSTTKSPVDSPTGENTPTDYVTTATTTYPAFQIVSRQEWLAQPRGGEPTPLKNPVPYVIIMHTATETCSSQPTCLTKVRSIQDFHKESRGWDDIGYSFLVGGDGNAYEGRGWNAVGAQVYGYNTRCIGIAFIGTFNQFMPTDRQLNAAKQLIEIGLKKGYIAKDYKLLAARQLQTTQSPGLMLYEHIKTWPHWAEQP